MAQLVTLVESFSCQRKKISCVIWQKKISRKNFYVPWTFQDVRPG